MAEVCLLLEDVLEGIGSHISYLRILPHPLLIDVFEALDEGLFWGGFLAEVLLRLFYQFKLLFVLNQVYFELFLNRRNKEPGLVAVDSLPAHGEGGAVEGLVLAVLHLQVPQVALDLRQGGRRVQLLLPLLLLLQELYLALSKLLL
mmetsp:Transcript_11335/g.11356  ORF Transcript_11335/g.11356 Transcript_11335/m.11356 type:complete len:146 (-) Transcript_11335:908-1345(-)